MLSALALAFGLAMDATAVCAARALGAGARRERWVLPLLFGAFQAGMAALGWLGGDWARAYIAEWDHWVAGGLLILIGSHMIVEAIRGGAEEAEAKPGTPLLYLGLAVATSIDAAAAGLTLPLYSHSGGLAPWLVLTVIGVVTSPPRSDVERQSPAVRISDATSDASSRNLTHRDWPRRCCRRSPCRVLGRCCPAGST